MTDSNDISICPECNSSQFVTTSSDCSDSVKTTSCDVHPNAILNEVSDSNDIVERLKEKAWLEICAIRKKRFQTERGHHVSTADFESFEFGWAKALQSQVTTIKEQGLEIERLRGAVAEKNVQLKNLSGYVLDARRNIAVQYAEKLRTNP